IGRDLAILWVERKSPRLPPEFQIPTYFLAVATMHQVYRDVDTTRLIGVGFGRTETGALPDSAVSAIIPIGSPFCAGGQFATSPCASLREFALADPNAAGGASPPDSCGGDSGGPVFWAPATAGAPTKDPDRFLVGVTSRALEGVSHDPGSTCGGGGIYTALGH